MCVDDRSYVYEANTKGDGIFEEDERIFHLSNAIVELDNHIKAYG